MNHLGSPFPEQRLNACELYCLFRLLQSPNNFEWIGCQMTVLLYIIFRFISSRFYKKTVNITTEVQMLQRDECDFDKVWRRWSAAYENISAENLQYDTALHTRFHLCMQCRSMIVMLSFVGNGVYRISTQNKLKIYAVSLGLFDIMSDFDYWAIPRICQLHPPALPQARPSCPHKSKSSWYRC